MYIIWFIISINGGARWFVILFGSRENILNLNYKQYSGVEWHSSEREEPNEGTECFEKGRGGQWAKSISPTLRNTNRPGSGRLVATSSCWGRGPIRRRGLSGMRTLRSCWPASRLAGSASSLGTGFAPSPVICAPARTLFLRLLPLGIFSLSSGSAQDTNQTTKPLIRQSKTNNAWVNTLLWIMKQNFYAIKDLKMILQVFSLQFCLPGSFLIVQFLL